MAATPAQTAFSFQVEIDGLAHAAFARVQLPRMERDLIRLRDGNDPAQTLRHLPGLLRLSDCVLEHAVLRGDTALFDWINGSGGGSPGHRNVAVRLQGEAQQPVRVWRLRNALPVALEWSALDAGLSGVLVETLRLAVEAMSVETA